MQLPLNIDVQQILLHWLNFVILAGGLYLLLYKPVKEFMDKREAGYQAKHDEANAILEQAKEKKAEYEDKLLKSDQEISEMKAQAMKEIENNSSAQIKNAQEEANEIIKVAHINAERTKQKMVEEAKEEITQLAIDATRKIMNDKEDPYRQFVESTQKEDDDYGQA